MKTKHSGRGGYRPGAGRKPTLKNPRSITMFLDEEQFKFCKKNSKTISHYIRSLIDSQMQLQKNSSQIAT